MTELDWLMTIQQWHTPFLDSVFMNITALGDRGFLWIMAGIVMMLTKKYRRQGLLLLVGLLLTVLVGNVLLKNLIQRDRPCWLYPEVPLLISCPKDFSFPSAHSMSSFAGATALWFTNRRYGIVAYIVAAAIAFSRLYLFVHWPTDVLVGSALGILVGMVVFYIAESREGKEKTEYENV